VKSIRELHIRDPFVITDKENNCYYLLVNSAAERVDNGPSIGLDYYVSTDLREFDGPYPAYRLPEGAVGHIGHGAPETHYYKGKWYAFDQITGGVLYTDGTFKIDPSVKMGEYIFVADKPTGPYKVHSNGALTPADAPCLDGTLFVDKDGQPWLVYSHEWTQIRDGAFEAIRLTDDLSASYGEVVHLFSASDPKWATGTLDRWQGFEDIFPNQPMYVTDAPFMFYDKSGALCTLWSTRIDDGFVHDAYVHTFARSESGKLEGPWTHGEKPMYTNDGGHAMLFEALDGTNKMAFHQPDRIGLERLMLMDVEYTQYGLKFVDESLDELRARQPKPTRTVNEMRIRDPFIVTDEENGQYYLFVNNGAARLDGKTGEGVDYYITKDLVHLDGPYPAMRPGENHPYVRMGFGAPEVHEYKGKWYMFTHPVIRVDGVDTKGVYPPGVTKGSQIFRADKVTGPYEPWSDGPATPADMVTLDGTLFVDKEGQPWMVYCHEWIQLTNGTVEAMRLSDDLKTCIGEPVLLFKGNAAPWARGCYVTGDDHDYLHRGKVEYITDAPFMFYDKSGALCTLWSTWSGDIYVTGYARSESGKLEGPWVQSEKPIYANNGGHGMLFKGLDGEDMIAFHQPNVAFFRRERMITRPVEITDNGLKLK